MKDKTVKKKRCPRCNGRMYWEIQKCPFCGLVFDRIQHLSNKQAKEEIKAKRKKNVLYITSMPEDINKIKFWISFIIAGWFGAHDLYIGKYGKGLYSLITGVLAVIAFIVQEVVLYSGGPVNVISTYFTNPMILFFVIAIFMWFWDLIGLTFKKFKYPASLSKDDYKKVLNEKIRGF